MASHQRKVRCAELITRQRSEDIHRHYPNVRVVCASKSTLPHGTNGACTKRQSCLRSGARTTAVVVVSYTVSRTQKAHTCGYTHTHRQQLQHNRPPSNKCPSLPRRQRKGFRLREPSRSIKNRRHNTSCVSSMMVDRCILADNALRNQQEQYHTPPKIHR